MPGHLFLSYSRSDAGLADQLEAAFGRSFSIWRDHKSIQAGSVFSAEIDAGLRSADGVVLLLTPRSAASPWVVYEYGFALGASVPVVAVLKDVEVPQPIRRFQAVEFEPAAATPAKVLDGLRHQREAQRATTRLVAQFREHDGEVVEVGGGKCPELGLELWVENPAPETQSVAYEIEDETVERSAWTIGRKRTLATKAFLTDDDLSLYGDVWIRAVGFDGRKRELWRSDSRLYEALLRSYQHRRPSKSVRRALGQIKTN
jgi:nucleoside 2-deoxyribosyltransferase